MQAVLGAVFLSSPRHPPLARFVTPQPGSDLAARIQDGDLITNSGFFDYQKRPKNRLHAGYVYTKTIILLNLGEQWQNIYLNFKE